MESLIGFSEVTAALVFSFGFALLLECLLLQYVIRAIARSTAPVAQRPSEQVLAALRRTGGI